ncbi:hypothetical protein BC936DRAFT_137601, partial [Jimgerdemannia flammicorona]
ILIRKFLGIYNLGVVAPVSFFKRICYLHTSPSSVLAHLPITSYARKHQVRPPLTTMSRDDRVSFLFSFIDSPSLVDWLARLRLLTLWNQGHWKVYQCGSGADERSLRCVEERGGRESGGRESGSRENGGRGSRDRVNPQRRTHHQGKYSYYYHAAHML